MEDKFKQIDCGDNDVLSFPEDVTFKVGKFRKAAEESFVDNVVEKFNEQLRYRGVSLDFHKLHPNGYWDAVKSFGKDGIDCEILNLGDKKWKKGKVKIKVSVEFYAEDEEILETPQINQSESPLDDLRQRLNEATQ
ncbi:MAG: KGK domain-containing protein [Nostocaceae cyanobacterium]|nr:KGK domain-containing protein [Nostocaceae cyanobacterium]